MTCIGHAFLYKIPAARVRKVRVTLPKWVKESKRQLLRWHTRQTRDTLDQANTKKWLVDFRLTYDGKVH
jgi:predicted membrane-bound dolichyl-phosphate-mannose-protein mannosyltransferase